MLQLNKIITVFYSNSDTDQKKRSKWVVLVNKSMIKCVILTHLGVFASRPKKGEKTSQQNKGRHALNMPTLK